MDSLSFGEMGMNSTDDVVLATQTRAANMLSPLQ